jgi:hypothetical protein
MEQGLLHGAPQQVEVPQAPLALQEQTVMMEPTELMEQLVPQAQLEQMVMTEPTELTEQLAQRAQQEPPHLAMQMKP